MQLKADVLGKPLMRVSSFDAPCLGAAVLGRAALEGGDPARIADEMTSIDKTFHPRPERNAVHAKRLSLYAELSEALRGPAQRLREIWAH
jgi:xylulokinase